MNSNNNSLIDGLRDLALSVPVGAIDPGRPADRLRRQTRRTRIAGSTFALIVVIAGLLMVAEKGSFQLATTGETDGFGSGSGGLTFSQRVVDGAVVEHPDLVVTSGDGSIYALSTAPGSASPSPGEGRAARALYHTSDGESWSVVELDGRRLSRLTPLGDLLYALSSSEGSGGPEYSLARSSDGGASWAELELPISLEPPSGAAFVDVEPYVNVDLAVTDVFFLASVEVRWAFNEQWLYALLGVEATDGLGLDYTDEGIVIVDYSVCNEVSTPVTTVSPGETNCSSSPVVAEATYDEIGVDGSSSGAGEFYGLRSLDGETWQQVELPGQRLSTAGDLVIAQQWGEQGQSTHISADGKTWARSEDGRSIKGVLGDKLISFEFDDRDGEDGLLAGPQRLVVGASDDGRTWTDTLVYENSDPALAPWPVAMSVGRLGALVVLNETPVDEAASYEDNVQSMDYQILFSRNGLDWQIVEVEDQPVGRLTWAFMTADSIALVYQTAGSGADGPDSPVTVLLTPER